MAALYLTSLQLDQLGRYKIAKNFILLPRGKTHIRLDQVPFTGGGLSRTVPLVSVQTEFAYLISSFHIKIDAVHTVTTDEDRIKTIEDWSDYLYFKFIDGGVWQPIWGYSKFSKTVGGRPGGTSKDTLPTEPWGDMMESARKFVNRLSQVTKEKQNLACGPVQGEGSNLIGQL
jgi:hypothetical protein